MDDIDFASTDFGPEEQATSSQSGKFIDKQDVMSRIKAHMKVQAESTGRAMTKDEVLQLIQKYVANGGIPRAANIPVDPKDYVTSTFLQDFLNELIDDLQSTASGLGASQIGINDAAGFYSAQNVEAALAEVFDKTILRVANVTAARALTAATDGAVLFVDGKDGGLFRRDATDTTSAENGGSFCGTIIRDTIYATAGVWKRVFDGAVDVRWFGAQGDGSNDDTAAFTASITASNETYVPETSSYYKLTSTVSLGFGKKLRGAHSRIVQATSNTPILSVSSSKWEVTGLRLEYLTQQGVSDTSAMGVKFDGAFEGEFTNSTISNAYKGFGVQSPTSFCYECTFRNIRVIDAYDYGVAIDVNGSVGLTTNTFDNVYVLQTSNSSGNTASKGFLIQYHTGGLVMRNCAVDKTQGGVVLFLKGNTGAVVDSFYCEANRLKNGSGLLTIDSCDDTTIHGYTPKSNVAVLTGGQTASFARIIGTSRNVVLTGRENGTDTTGNAGTIYSVDANSSDTAVRIDALGFRVDSAFNRNDALITSSYRQIWSYNGTVLQEEQNGRKRQWRSAAPTTGTWAQGDRVPNSSPSTSSPVTEWACIIAGTPGTWRPCEWVILRGATAARPTLLANDIGVTYLDNTLDADGKPIWWNGTAWVDATGAVV